MSSRSLRLLRRARLTTVLFEWSAWPNFPTRDGVTSVVYIACCLVRISWHLPIDRGVEHISLFPVGFPPISDCLRLFSDNACRNSSKQCFLLLPLAFSIFEISRQMLRAQNGLARPRPDPDEQPRAAAPGFTLGSGLPSTYSTPKTTDRLPHFQVSTPDTAAPLNLSELRLKL